MKKWNALLLAAMAVTLAGAFTACKGNDEELYTFTFNTRGGTPIEALELAEGDIVPRPADPVKEMFTFGDWYEDEACSAVYTFSAMPAHDVTVYAGWVDPQTSVRIEYVAADADAGSVAAPSIGLVGSTFKQPASPTRTGYVFSGWYTSSDCAEGTRYSFTVFPEESMTLYAGWVRNTEQYAFISYYGNGRLLSSPEPVLKGSAFSPSVHFGADIVTPAQGTEKYDWFLDEDYLQPYEGGTVDGDLTLYTYYYTAGLEFDVPEGQPFSGEVEVRRYLGEARQVIVPDAYSGISVTGVGEGAFSGTNVTSVSLPDSIRTLSAKAFMNCAYLTNVSLTAGAEEIGSYAFMNCVRLESCGDLSGVAVIPEGCFLGCSQLRTITLSEETVTVEALAFSDCVSLASLTLPDSVRVVGAQAFEGCTSLASLALSANLNDFAADALANCPALRSVTLPAGNADFTLENGALLHDTQLIRMIADEGVTSYTLPAGVSQVSAYAFENSPALTELVFHADAQLAQGALIGLTALERLTLPAKDFSGGGFLAALFGAKAAETSGTYSFFIPATLSALSFSGSVTALADYAFYGATGLSSVTGLDEVKSIGTGAFAYTAMTAFELPASVTAFGSRVFEGCGLDSYAVAAANTSYFAYDDCLYSQAGALVAVPVQKTQIAFPETESYTLTSVGEYALYGSAVTALTLPQTVTSIGFAALGNMQALTELSVPVLGDGDQNPYMAYVFGARLLFNTPEAGFSSLFASLPGNLPSKLNKLTLTAQLTSIPAGAFALLEQVTSVTVGTDETHANITSYGMFAFYHTPIAQWSFSENTESIGESAFRGTALTQVSLPGALGDGLGMAAFAEINALERLTLGEGITRIPAAAFYTAISSGEVSEQDGYTYEVRRSRVNEELVIPASVTEIASEAFRGIGMKEYWEPTSLEYQPDAYLHGTRNENFSLTFAQGTKLTSIGDYAFEGCGLASLTLPASLTSLGKGALQNNLYLERVAVGSESEGSVLAELGALALADCTKLASVTLYCASVPAMELSEGEHALRDAHEELRVYVREEVLASFRATQGWSLLAERIEAIPAQETQGGEA